MRGAAAWILVTGASLIALSWVPPMPVAGAQLSDAICAIGVGLALLATAPRVLRARIVLTRSTLALIAALASYFVLAGISTLATHGSVTRLLGTWWLVMLSLGVAACADPADIDDSLRWLRRALVIAAAIGAATGLLGAVLFFAGKRTDLLNIPGDLVPGDYPRIRGTMMRANALAGLLATGILLAGELPAPVRRAVRVLLFVALVFTFSRSLIALAGTLAVMHFAFGARRSQRTAILAAVATAAVMLVVSWADVRLDPSHPWRVKLLVEPGTRLVHLRDALHTIASHPWTGIGPGRAAAAGGWDAHFTLANVAAIMGIPAALALLAIFTLTLRAAWRAARASHDTAGFALTSVLLLFGFDALARDVEDQRALWIVMGLVFATTWSSQRRAESAQVAASGEGFAR